MKKEYRNNLGEPYREDGSAVEFTDGAKIWYRNELLHREDGPAIEYADGTKYWYINGKFHREDGPAIEYADGGKVWWLYNMCYGEKKPDNWDTLILQYRAEKLLDT